MLFKFYWHKYHELIRTPLEQRSQVCFVSISIKLINWKQSYYFTIIFSRVIIMCATM